MGCGSARFVKGSLSSSGEKVERGQNNIFAESVVRLPSLTPGISPLFPPPSSGLEQHVNSGTHSEKAYKCDDCGRKFAKMAQLVSHTNTSSCRHAAHAATTLVNDYQRGPERLMLTNGGEPTYEATLYFDGSARPNPGNGGMGYVLYGVHGNELDRGCYAVDEYNITNNEAEWMALVLGLREAQHYNIKTLRIHGDSELVLNQMKGTYQVNSSLLKPYYDEAKYLQNDFLRCSFEHVSRSSNSVADQLAGQAADGYGDPISRDECMY